MQLERFPIPHMVCVALILEKACSISEIGAHSVNEERPVRAWNGLKVFESDSWSLVQATGVDDDDESKSIVPQIRDSRTPYALARTVSTWVSRLSMGKCEVVGLMGHYIRHKKIQPD